MSKGFTERKEVIKVFGILGALDPYRHKQNQLILEGRQDDEMGTGKIQKIIQPKVLMGQSVPVGEG